MSGFQDHFSRQSDDYAKHRPTYPPELFEFVASIAPAHDHAWDCATGNGQAARGLSAHFERVIATDASEQQIANAQPAERVEYRVATAEASGLQPRSVSAVTAATAFHWFDHERFADEVLRVAKPGAVVCVWAYAWSEMPEAPRTVLRERVSPLLEPFWADAVRRAWQGYGVFHFPFDEIEPPQFEVRRNWTADEFIAYASTWSAVQAFAEAHGYLPHEAHADAIREAWGDEPQEIRWPLTMRVGHVG